MNPGHVIFGSGGDRHWYGKRLTNISGEVVWDTLEAVSDHRRDDFSTWPLTELEKRQFLPITLTGKKATALGIVDVELSDPTVDEMRGPLTRIDYQGDEPTETVIARRRFNVPYWDLSETLGINADLARTQITDARTADHIPHLDACVHDKGEE